MMMTMRSRRQQLNGYKLDLRFFCRVCILLVSVMLLGLVAAFMANNNTIKDHEIVLEYNVMETTDGKESGTTIGTEAEIDIGC